MRKPFLSLLLAVLIVVSLLPAAAPAAHAQDDRLQIVASFSILADVIANVAGDAADVSSLMPPFANPHGYIPTPQDLVRLADADVIFVVGAGFEEGLEEAIANAGDTMHIVVASSCIEILPFGADDHAHEEHEESEHEEHDHEGDGMHHMADLCAAHHTEMDVLHGHMEGEHDADHDHDEDDADHAHDEDDADHDHDHDHMEALGMLYALNCGGHDHEADEGEHTHEAGSCDPHVWTDPHNGIYWAMMAHDMLSELDPAHAETYAANTAAYIAALDALAHDEIMPLLAAIPEENRLLVTNHLAYGYFAHAFGLNMIGTVIPGASSLAEPSAAEAAALIDTINELGVPAIFAEMTANPDLAERIAAETGADIFTLYTGTLSEADGPASTYLDYLRHSAETIAHGLSGE